MTNLSPARQLFQSHRFEEAVAAYRRQLQEKLEKKWINTAGLAESLLASGQYVEAIPLFEKVGEYQTSYVPGTLGCQEQLCVCHWMMGNREEALEIVKEWVLAVRDGRITFTDFAGGVTQGLILCYMAITLRSIADVDLAMEYLKGLASQPRIENWPGPAALFLLGALTFGEAMKNAADLAQTKKTDQDGWKGRYLTALFFAAGTERRMAGDEAGCRMFMAECASLTNSLVEYEWYLAKGEVPAPS